VSPFALDLQQQDARPAFERILAFAHPQRTAMSTARDEYILAQHNDLIQAGFSDKPKTPGSVTRVPAQCVLSLLGHTLTFSLLCLNFTPPPTGALAGSSRQLQQNWNQGGFWHNGQWVRKGCWHQGQWRQDWFQQQWNGPCQQGGPAAKAEGQAFAQSNTGPAMAASNADAKSGVGGAAAQNQAVAIGAGGAQGQGSATAQTGAGGAAAKSGTTAIQTGPGGVAIANDFAGAATGSGPAKAGSQSTAINAGQGPAISNSASNAISGGGPAKASSGSNAIANNGPAIASSSASAVSAGK
jgi:hypothetical protein